MRGEYVTFGEAQTTASTCVTPFLLLYNQAPPTRALESSLLPCSSLPFVSLSFIPRTQRPGPQLQAA